MNITLDGYIEGPQGEIDWIDSWEDADDSASQYDACLLGSGMYGGYEQYWTAVRHAPDQPLPFSSAMSTAGEIARSHRRSNLQLATNAHQWDCVPESYSK